MLVTVLAVALHHVLGLLAGYVTAKVFRFNEKKVRTLSLEVGLQNSGLSCTLAKTAFPDTMAILPAAHRVSERCFHGGTPCKEGRHDADHL